MSLSSLKKSALIWIISGSFLLGYSCLGLFGVHVPGVEQLVWLINQTTGSYFYLTAFLAAFIEGLYLIGHLIPGSTLMVLVAVLAVPLGQTVFFTTFIFLWLGWVLAGIINIYLAAKLLSKENLPPVAAEDKILITWYPAFRANHEVAEIALGVKSLDVVISSVRVKTLACLVLMVYSYVLNLMMDINKINNQDGFAVVIIFSLISIAIGSIKWKRATIL